MRRLFALVTLALAALLFAGCSHDIGTVGYIGGQRVSEAEVDRVADAFAPHGYTRDQVTLFVVEAKAAQAILAAKGMSPDYAQRAEAATYPAIAELLDDPRTREVTLGVLDFGSLGDQMQQHGLALAVADTVELNPRYGKFTAVVDPASGALRYTITGLTGDDTGALSTVAAK